MLLYNIPTYRSHISVWLSRSRLVWSWPVPRSSLFCLMCLCEGFLVLLSAWYFCIAAWLPSPLSDDSGETLRRFLLKEERGQYNTAQYRCQYNTVQRSVQYFSQSECLQFTFFLTRKVARKGWQNSRVRWVEMSDLWTKTFCRIVNPFSGSSKQLGMTSLEQKIISPLNRRTQCRRPCQAWWLCRWTGWSPRGWRGGRGRWRPRCRAGPSE